MTEKQDPSHFPLVTIGIPAFNSARHVRRSIESLVGQDYPNLQIVISDDGSTDETASICDEMAMTDPRIEVHRRTHLGERHNFNAVLAAARGPYFMWAADHDVWGSRYVSACVAALELHPKAVLACSHTMLICEDGAELGVMDDELGIDQLRPVDRYRALIWRLRWCNAIYGVMRREAATATGGYGSTPSPDHPVLARMALRGSFVQLRKRSSSVARTGHRRRSRKCGCANRGAWNRTGRTPGWQCLTARTTAPFGTAISGPSSANCCGCATNCWRSRRPRFASQNGSE